MKNIKQPVIFTEKDKLITWTNSDSKDQHFYFTSPTITDDGKYLLIISNRNGHPNIYAIDRESREIIQISNSQGLLCSYTYPEGGKTGLSKASPFLDSKNNKVYWIQDDALWVAKIEKESKPVHMIDLPAGWVGGYTHLSSDGQYFCVPVTDPNAFSSTDLTQHEQLKNVPLRMLRNSLTSKLIIINVGTKTISRTIELPFWATHVQFHPQNNEIIICNSEGGLSSNAERKYPYWGRIWIIDKYGNYSRLIEQAEGEYINHENFYKNSDRIIFHGKKKQNILLKGIYYGFILLNKIKSGVIKKEVMDNLFSHFVTIREINKESISYKRMSHPVSHAIAGSKSMNFVTDSRDGFIYVYYNEINDFSSRKICWHGSTMNEQDAHPHPNVSSSGGSIIFTSNVEGVCNVYEIVLEKKI